MSAHVSPLCKHGVEGHERKVPDYLQVKFREFYPGDRILVKDLGKQETWSPGSVAKRSRPSSYLPVLDGGRVCRNKHKSELVLFH